MIGISKDQDTIALEDIANAIKEPLTNWFDREIVCIVSQNDSRRGGRNFSPELAIGYHATDESFIEHIIKGKRVRVPSSICGIDIRTGKEGKRAIYVQPALESYRDVLVNFLREYSAKNGFGELLTG